MTRDFESAERIIMPKRTPSINLKKSAFFVGGYAAINDPPKRAPTPSTEVRIPTPRDPILKFSTSKIPIRATKGKPKILKIGVSNKTVRIFLSLSDSLRTFFILETKLFSLPFFICLSFWENKKQVDAM